MFNPFKKTVSPELTSIGLAKSLLPIVFVSEHFDSFIDKEFNIENEIIRRSLITTALRMVGVEICLPTIASPVMSEKAKGAFATELNRLTVLSIVDVFKRGLEAQEISNLLADYRQKIKKSIYENDKSHNYFELAGQKCCLLITGENKHHDVAEVYFFSATLESIFTESSGLFEDLAKASIKVSK
jgi:hypothetical protein